MVELFLACSQLRDIYEHLVDRHIKARNNLCQILHQFTMLKLLDCTPNEDNTYSYQLNVNPADNPECFEDVA